MDNTKPSWLKRLSFLDYLNRHKNLSRASKSIIVDLFIRSEGKEGYIEGYWPGHLPHINELLRDGLEILEEKGLITVSSKINEFRGKVKYNIILHDTRNNKNQVSDLLDPSEK